MRSITIDWSYPMEINNILADERMSDRGNIPAEVYISDEEWIEE